MIPYSCITSSGEVPFKFPSGFHGVDVDGLGVAYPEASSGLRFACVGAVPGEICAAF
ncbi:MAG TPA: hypothetical protein PKJ43_05080 [Prolixibacteraceae bacterium]|nr:hypothetical protein [Prolixibacteraceae bacterium]